MEITVTIPPSVEAPLCTYAASLFYDTSSYALSQAIVCALIHEMDSARLVSRDEIVEEVLKASQPPAFSLPVLAVPEVSAASVQKPEIATATMVITDPKKLKVPREQFHGDTSNTWLVWGWCVSFSLPPNTPDSGPRKFRKFRLQDVLQGVMQQKGIRIKDTTAYSALDVLVKRQWLTFTEAKKRYILSPIAQKWALVPQNQTYLIEKGFLGLPEESDLIYK